MLRIIAGEHPGTARIALEVQLDQVAIGAPGGIPNEPRLADLARTAKDDGASPPRPQPGEKVLCPRSFQSMTIETTRCFCK
jgi:hypothetical protein